MGGSRAPVRVDVLGPLRVTDDAGCDVTPDGGLQRRLMALLTLRRGHVVSADAAIDALWPAARPADPSAALQNHVSRLRRALPDGAIESVGDGYRLDPGAVDVDADRLGDLLAAGAPAGDATMAELDAVLDRWLGPAYPELDEVDDGRAEATRLEEVRCRAREQRAEALLARGDAGAAVADLVALGDEQPLRERPRELLMAALAASGRHAEALRVYDDFRRRLGNELGIEPSPALAARHTELLAGRADAIGPTTRRLPAPATSLVGRDALVDQVLALAGEARVVTLVGPGGVGKTRLLVEVGHRLAAADATRPVVLCELAGADRATALDAVAAALGIDARPGTPLAERVADVVGDADVVVLLDNCEHVLEEAAAFVELLVGRCPGARVLATSRERLRVPGEQVCPVPTLPIAGDDAPAVELFVARARAVVPSFGPDPAERPAIAQIVARLDGLPLAIELAASRLHTHDLADIAAGLDERFALLSSGYRTSSRHGSLSAAVSWSFGLLDSQLQQTFADLSVFSGAFGVEDAAAISAVEPAVAADRLSQLVERSLVMRVAARRYVLLETLRAFGAEQLRHADRVDLVAERHAHHQVAWAEHADRRLLHPGEHVIEEIDAALPELRAALDWLLDHGEIEPAARLVAALADYGLMRLRPDVLAWSERLLAADPDDRLPLAPRMWGAAGYAAWHVGDVPEAGRRSARGVRVAEAQGIPVPAEVATIHANVELFEGRLDAAAAWYRRAAETAGSTDPAQRLIAEAAELLALGYAGVTVDAQVERLLAEVGEAPTPYAAHVWYCAGEAVLAIDAELARARFAQALRLADLTTTSFVTGVAGASKASLDARTGDPVAAARDYRRLIDHWRRAGVWSTQWTMLRSIAGLLERLGRHEDAAVVEGAVRGIHTGHRIFGADAEALDALSDRLRRQLGDDAYAAARDAGGRLDGDAAVEHARRALGSSG